VRRHQDFRIPARDLTRPNRLPHRPLQREVLNGQRGDPALGVVLLPRLGAMMLPAHLARWLTLLAPGRRHISGPSRFADNSQYPPWAARVVFVPGGMIPTHHHPDALVLTGASGPVGSPVQDGDRTVSPHADARAEGWEYPALGVAGAFPGVVQASRSGRVCAR
jgi:hypothetical protein